ncbi:MAG: MATE family efflux transporter [Bacteroidales bacterium]|nr:MATE family efflux transporter [Bacteroidales bacterium]
MTNDLTVGNPTGVILKYSVPIIIGNVFQQVYNLVDTIIVGRYVGYQALAGLGITNGLTFFILGFVLGVTSGLGIKTAQYFGAGDIKSVKRSVGTSLLICVGMSILLTLLSTLSIGPVLHWLGTREDIYQYAYDYVFVIFAGLVSQVAYNMIACILRALGDSKTPLYFLIFSSVLNVILDILFIASFGWGVKGAAYGTIIAQSLSAIICFYYAFRKYPELALSREDFRTTWDFIWEHLRIGLPMAFQFSITAVGVVLLQSALNAFPATYIAGFTAANKIQQLGSIIAISFGVAMANYAGQNYGAGKIARARKGVRVTVAMTMVVCLVASLTIAIFNHGLTSLFMENGVAGNAEEIFYASRVYLYFSACFYPFLFLIFIYRNALQGIGYTFWPLMAGFFELFIRIIFSKILPHYMGYIGLPLADVMAWFGAFTVLVISYYIQMPKPEQK